MKQLTGQGRGRGRQWDAVEVQGQTAALAAEDDAFGAGAGAAAAAASAAVAAAVQSLEAAGLTELTAVRRQLAASRSEVDCLKDEVLGKVQLQAQVGELCSSHGLMQATLQGVNHALQEYCPGMDLQGLRPMLRRCHAIQLENAGLQAQLQQSGAQLQHLRLQLQQSQMELHTLSDAGQAHQQQRHQQQWQAQVGLHVLGNQHGPSTLPGQEQLLPRPLGPAAGLGQLPPQLHAVRMQRVVDITEDNGAHGPSLGPHRLVQVWTAPASLQQHASAGAQALVYVRQTALPGWPVSNYHSSMPIPLSQPIRPAVQQHLRHLDIAPELAAIEAYVQKQALAVAQPLEKEGELSAGVQEI